MPFTFSHPLAVVPLRRFCPARLNFAALVIGSLSPDFGYYVRSFPMASFAHTFSGTLLLCLPTGLLALWIFNRLRVPLCLVLPQPHRSALMPLALAPSDRSPCSIFIAALSVLLGAWTHAIWDSFTHHTGWAVQHFAALRQPLLDVGGTALPTSYFLQQASTLAGGAALVVIYLSWLRRQPAASDTDFLPDRWRYVLLALLAAASLTIAAPPALRMASHFEAWMAFRVFVFRLGVYSAAIFIPLLLASAIALDAYRRRASERR